MVGEASDGEEAVRLAKQLKPDVIIMDIAMPKLNGIEATKQIKQLPFSTHILILTAYDYEEYVFPILEAGAVGYLLKDMNANELIGAIHTVCKGESILHPAVARKLIEQFRNSSVKHGREALPRFRAREDSHGLSATGSSVCPESLPGRASRMRETMSAKVRSPRRILRSSV